MILQKLLDPKAQERLGNIRAANPSQAEKVEAMLFYLYQSGQIKEKITEDLLKQILSKLSAKRETKIIRK
jgi:programmed cell death protein 5